MTFKRGYDRFSAKPIVPASEAAVIEAQATADAALDASPAPDGSPPATNPTIAVRPGIGSLFVVWEPITNADPVTYDVYAVPAADVARLAYPPLSTDRVGEADGTAAAFRALPDGTDLTPADSYAVAVYARDADGQCTTSATPVIASPAQVTSEDLALNALTVGHLTVNDALFIALQAEDIVGVNITGSSITGTEFRTADAGAYWRMGVGTQGAIAIEGVYDGGEDMTDLGGILNRSLAATLPGGEAYQESTVLIRSGRFDDGTGAGLDGHVEITAAATRQETTPGGPWALPTSTLNLAAQGDGSALNLNAKHIKLATWSYPGRTLDLWGGDTVLYGVNSVDVTSDQAVTIAGPTVAIDSAAVTINGVPYSGASAVGKSARLRKTAAQSTTNAAWTILTFDSEMPSPYVASTSWFTNVAGTYTCGTPGFYTLSPAVLFTSGAAGTRRIISIVQNGIRVIRNDISAKATAAAAAGVSVTDSLYFAAGDTFRIESYQDSGAALNTTSADGSDHATLSITRTA